MAYGNNITESLIIIYLVAIKQCWCCQGEVTFTPRLLLVDLQGSLGSLPQHGGVYDATQVPDPTRVPWEQPVEVVRTEPVEPNEFQADLEQNSGTVYSTTLQGLHKG